MAQFEKSIHFADNPKPGDRMGYGVGVDGSWFVAGAPFADGPGFGGGQGELDVWKKVGRSWYAVPGLRHLDAVSGDNLGFSVAIAEDVIAGGAPGRTEGSESEVGAVYVWELQGAEWIEVAKLLASDGTDCDMFGWSVATDGQRIAVQAVNDDPYSVGGGRGSVYVFTRQTDGSWIEEQKLVAADPLPVGIFGHQLSLSGDVMLTCDPNDGEVGFIAGACYVFDFNGSTWDLTAKLFGSDTVASSAFGCDVALDGDRFAVGSCLHDLAAPNAGAAYIFENIGGVWTETAALTASDAASFDNLGCRLDLEGDTLAVSATGFQSSQGKVYAFQYDGTTWNEVAGFVASDGEQNDQFGEEVGLEGLEIVATSIETNLDDLQQVGSAYVMAIDGGDCILFRSTPRVSVSLGGTVDLTLDADASLQGSLYVLAGSTTGSDPGIQLQGFVLPLTFDSFTLQTLTDPASVFLSFSFGQLDANGDAAAALVIPPGIDTSLIGLQASFAALIYDLSPFQVGDVSNAVTVTLDP